MATMLIQRVTGGKPRRQVLGDCMVLVDNRQVGVVGERVSIDPGQHVVSVRAKMFWTCNRLSVFIRPEEDAVLHYRATPAGWLTVLAVVPVFLAFSPLFAVGLNAVRATIENLPPILESVPVAVLLFVAALSVMGWIAAGLLPWLFASVGIYSYRLSVAEQSKVPRTSHEAAQG